MLGEYSAAQKREGRSERRAKRAASPPREDSSSSESDESGNSLVLPRSERSTARSTGRSTHISSVANLEVAGGGAYRESVDVDKRDRRSSPHFEPKRQNFDEEKRNYLDIPDTPDQDNRTRSFGSDMTSVYRASGAERSVSPLNRDGNAPSPADRWGVNRTTSTSPVGAMSVTPSAYYRDKTPTMQPISSPQSPGQPAIAEPPPPKTLMSSVPRLIDTPSLRSKSPSLSNTASNYTGTISHDASSTRTCSTHSTRSAPYGYSAHPDLPGGVIHPANLREYHAMRGDPRNPSRRPKGRKRSKRPRDKHRGVDPYRFLTTGTPLQKYCRRKDPHYRHFEVNQELEYLQWYSPSKSTKKTRIPLDSIVDILTGQNSPGFRKNPRPRLKHQSFSISYSGGKKYLDLICMNKRDHFLWVTSLKNLLKNISEGQRWAKMDRIHVRESQAKSKNAVYMHTDSSDVGTTWKKYKEDLTKAGEQLADLSKRSEPLDRDLRRRLKDLGAKVNKWSQESDENQYLLQKQTDALRRHRMIIRVLEHKVDCLLKEQKAKGGNSLFNNLLRRNTTMSPQLDPWQVPRSFTSPSGEGIAGFVAPSRSPRRRSSLRLPKQKGGLVPSSTKGLLQRSMSDQRLKSGRNRTKSLGDRPTSWIPPDHRRKINRSPRRKPPKGGPPSNRALRTTPRAQPRGPSPRSHPRHQSPGPRHPSPPVVRVADPVPPEWYRVLPREKKLLLRKMLVNDIKNSKGRLSQNTLGRVCSSFRVTIKQAEALGRYLKDKYSDFQMILS